MNRYVLGALVFLLLIAPLSLSAATTLPSNGDEHAAVRTPVHRGHAPALGSIAPTTCGDGTGDCILNPDPDPGGSTGGCTTTVTDCNSCNAKCDCQYSANKQKCGSNADCIDLATSEHNACLANCMTDWCS